MNAPELRRSGPVILVAALSLGLTGLVRGQTPTQSAPPSEGKPQQDALNARRPELAVPAPPSSPYVFQRGPDPFLAIVATTTTSASGEIPALRIGVNGVNESRNSERRGSFSFSLSIEGEGLPLTAIVKQITVTKAVDNLGNVLGAGTSGGRGGATIMQSRLAGGRGGISPLTGRVTLDAPVRKAESLQYVEGNIEFFLPTEANGSLIRIPNVLSHAGRIEDPALAKQGIEFHFLPDQASYDEAKTQVAGFHDRPPLFHLRPNVVAYSYRDPSGRLAFLQLQESNGTVIPSSGFSEGRVNGSTTGDIQLLAPLPVDAQLVFFLITPEATKSVPFRVENIPLP